jgi:hypothetical protein
MSIALLHVKRLAISRLCIASAYDRMLEQCIRAYDRRAYALLVHMTVCMNTSVTVCMNTALLNVKHWQRVYLHTYVLAA